MIKIFDPLFISIYFAAIISFIEKLLFVAIIFKKRIRKKFSVFLWLGLFTLFKILSKEYVQSCYSFSNLTALILGHFESIGTFIMWWSGVEPRSSGIGFQTFYSMSNFAGSRGFLGCFGSQSWGKNTLQR